MNNNFHSNWSEVRLPRLVANDESAYLIEWSVTSGENVCVGQEIAILESSKATHELEADIAGYLYHLVDAGTQVSVNDPIALMLPKVDDSGVERYRHELSSALSEIPDEANNKPEGINLTKKALELAKQANLDFRLLPRGRILRSADIRRFITGATERNPDCLDESGTGIILVGGGGFGQMCIELIREMGAYNLIGVLDSTLPVGQDVLGIPVIGRDKELGLYRKQGIVFACNAVGSVGLSTARVGVYERLKAAGFVLPSLIHPRAIVSASAIIGEGCIIEANAVVGPSAVLGSNCIINVGAVVSHDCQLGDHVHIAPSATLAGDVVVGDRSIIGMGVNIYLDVIIGSDVIVSNGQNIFDNVEDGTRIH